MTESISIQQRTGDSIVGGELPCGKKDYLFLLGQFYNRITAAAASLESRRQLADVLRIFAHRNVLDEGLLSDCHSATQTILDFVPEYVAQERVLFLRERITMRMDDVIANLD